MMIRHHTFLKSIMNKILIKNVLWIVLPIGLMFFDMWFGTISSLQPHDDIWHLTAEELAKLPPPSTIDMIYVMDVIKILVYSILLSFSLNGVLNIHHNTKQLIKPVI